MAEKKKYKIKDIADKLGTQSKKIAERLAEIGITKSPAGSLDEDELRKLYEHIGDKKGLEELDGKKEEPEEKTESQQAKPSPVTQRTTTSQTTGAFIIGRRVVQREDNSYSNYSSTDDRKGSDKGRKGGDSSAASSDTLVGFTKSKRPGDYSTLLQQEKGKTQVVKRETKKEAPVEEKKEETSEAPQTTSVIRKVRRVTPSASVEEKKEEPEKAAETKPEEEAAKPETKVIKIRKIVKEEKPEETKPEEVAQKEEKTESQSEQTQVKEPPKQEPKEETKPEPESKPEPEKQDDKKPKEAKVPEKKEEERKPAEQRRSQDQQRTGDRTSQRTERSDRYEKTDKAGRTDAKQGYRMPQDDRQRQGDQNRPVRRTTQMPAAPDTQEEKKRRPLDNSFNRLNKKEKQESAASRNQNNAGPKNKYQTERQYIGHKQGVNEVMSDAFSYEMENPDYNSRGRRDKKSKNKQIVAPKQPVAVLTNVKLPETMTVKEFAEEIKKSVGDVIKKMLMLGTIASQNEVIGFDTMEIIASEFGITAEKEVVVSVEEQIFDDSEDENDEGAVPRPPVVVVMGHVDHGKTSLLDAIRSTSVTAGEAGGITQHIGAYTVKINGRNITFLDTPGHEAFTAMRARGAMVTDVAILVVAADDGVKPQTIEAINHAKAAKVSIVVAVNKMDKEGANLEKVRQELAEHDVVCEEWGGDVPFIPVSAKKHQNIEQLLETVLLSADILELKANPEKQAKGTIIEAKLDKNKGPVATLLVQRGTLKQGDYILSGTVYGRVRTMSDDKGSSIKKAGPSTPVEITGLPEVPEAGETFYVVEDEHKAKQVVEHRKTAARENMIKATTKVSLDDLYSRIQEGQMKELNIIVKADVQGSVEAVKQSLEKLSNDEVKIKIIHGAVGAINESDVTLASVSNAIIIGFNVRPVQGIAEHAESMGVDMRLYRVIYDAIEDIQAAMRGMLEPEFKEVAQGTCEIRQIFKVSGVGSIAGCYVTSGKIVRNSNVRIVRNGIVVYEGKLASLKRFKDDAREVAQGFECGLSFERFNDIKESDIVECYSMEEIKRT